MMRIKAGARRNLRALDKAGYVGTACRSREGTVVRHLLWSTGEQPASLLQSNFFYSVDVLLSCSHAGSAMVRHTAGLAAEAFGGPRDLDLQSSTQVYGVYL
jgi:hypothetical protein